MPHDLIKGCFGVLPLHCASHPHNCISNNGLPVTPNSVRLVGRFQVVRELQHPNLCQYLDAVKSKGELVAIVSEYHAITLLSVISNPPQPRAICHDVLSALQFLHNNKIVHRCISLKNIVITSSGIAKLSNFGIFDLTEGGVGVEHFVGDMCHSAPEVLLGAKSSSKCDIWSFGVVLLEMLLRQPLIDLTKHEDFSTKTKLLFSSEIKLINKLQILGTPKEGPEADLFTLLSHSLTVKPSERWGCSKLLTLPYFAQCTSRKQGERLNFFRLFRCQEDEEEQSEEEAELEEPLSHICTLPELYSLWKMSGGDVLAELEKWGLVRGSVPVCDLPLAALPSGPVYPAQPDIVLGQDQKIYPIVPSTLVKRLQHVESEAFYPLVESPSALNENMKEMSMLPAVIKERNMEYQLHRIILFKTLLNGYPHTVDRLRTEAMLDVPPLLRGHIWAALLEVGGDIELEYAQIDKSHSVGTVDRQIEVDIPRCHQYHHFLSSPTGHERLRRVLKAWVVDHPHLTYWQGLDSLAAPFLVLHPANEALAYACLKQFIKKYVHNFFLQDNSAVMTEYLCVFCHLLMFHDPELALHLQELNFIPELYAIPWFLTMFTHVFPLQKVFYLWDTMLLGNSSLPLFLGAAILIQVRETLLLHEFNECILLFSDMPDVDIDKIIREAMKMYQVTPITLTYRKQSYYQQENELLPPPPAKHSKYTYNFTQSFLTHHLQSFPTMPELKDDVSPRVFIQDLIKLLRHQENQILKGSKQRSRIIVVDINSPEVFATGHIPDSLNVPIASKLLNSDNNPASRDASTLFKHRRRRDAVVVVVGPSVAAMNKFCSTLLSLHFLHVTMVHGGSNALSQAEILCAGL